jgi:predicted transcriptional regulator
MFTEELKRQEENKMAKIDVSKIEGYAEMSAEEKLKALEAYNVPDPDLSGYVSKEQFDKTASELAAKKKELRDKLTDDEAAKQKEQEERDTMQKELEALRRESLVSKNKSRLIALGYEEALADETAEAMADGKIEKVFANQKKHLEAFEKKVRAEALKNTPKPTGDGDGKTISLKDFRSMSSADRLKFSQEHPDEYKELYTGGN